MIQSSSEVQEYISIMFANIINIRKILYVFTGVWVICEKITLTRVNITIIMNIVWLGLQLIYHKGDQGV